MKNDSILTLQLKIKTDNPQLERLMIESCKIVADKFAESEDLKAVLSIEYEISN